MDAMEAPDDPGASLLSVDFRKRLHNVEQWALTGIRRLEQQVSVLAEENARLQGEVGIVRPESALKPTFFVESSTASSDGRNADDPDVGQSLDQVLEHLTDSSEVGKAAPGAMPAELGAEAQPPEEPLTPTPQFNTEETDSAPKSVPRRIGSGGAAPEESPRVPLSRSMDSSRSALGGTVLKVSTTTSTIGSPARSDGGRKLSRRSTFGSRLMLHECWLAAEKMYVSETVMEEPHEDNFSEDPQFAQVVNRLMASKKGQFILEPMSPICVAWEALLVVLITYDFVVVPLYLAFEPEEIWLNEIMSWCTRVCWTLNMPLQCNTGFVIEDGSIEGRHSEIIRKYLKTWAIFDLVVVGIEWFQVIVDGYEMFESMPAMLRLLRIVRILRVIRLFRMCRLPSILHLINRRAHVEKAEFLVGFVKISFLMLGLAHLIACLWFAIGRQHTGWVIIHGYETATLTSSYTVSLYWALTQFAGNIDIYPSNSAERLFGVFTLGVCFFASAFFLSEITASLTRLTIASGAQGQLFSKLRQYLDMHRISRGLSLRVVKAVQHQLLEKQRVMPEAEVEMLQFISQPLMADIHYEIYSPVITSHPFFRHLHLTSHAVVRRICDQGMGQLVMSSADTIFVRGERPSVPKMYFVAHGKLMYIRPVRWGQEPTTVLSPHDWACEMVLWVRWKHRGDLRAVTTGAVHTLDADTFTTVACDGLSAMYASLYARELYQLLTLTDPAPAPAYETTSYLDVDDVSLGGADLEAITARIFPGHSSEKDQEVLWQSTMSLPGKLLFSPVDNSGEVL